MVALNTKLNSDWVLWNTKGYKRRKFKGSGLRIAGKLTKLITKLIHKFTKLSKKGFSMECLITDFSRISGITASICFLGCRLGTGHQDPSISQIFLKFPYILIFWALEFAPYRANRHCVKSVQRQSFFWSAFSRIRTEYGDILRISPYSVRMRENTDQKKLRLSAIFTQWKAISR